LAALCRRFHVRRLDVFGSAARATNFDLARFVDLKEALETLLARRVDLVDRKAIEGSPNYIRKRHILTGAEPIYAA
jgi:hypothetical protein